MDCWFSIFIAEYNFVFIIQCFSRLAFLFSITYLSQITMEFPNTHFIVGSNLFEIAYETYWTLLVQDLDCPVRNETFVSWNPQDNRLHLFSIYVKGQLNMAISTASESLGFICELFEPLRSILWNDQTVKNVFVCYLLIFILLVSYRTFEIIRWLYIFFRVIFT